MSLFQIAGVQNYELLQDQNGRGGLHLARWPTTKSLQQVSGNFKLNPQAQTQLSNPTHELNLQT